MRKILFQHIPKTAGTSLIARARDHFGLAVCDARYDFQLSDDAIVDDAYIFYHGHFTQDVVERFKTLQPNAFVFTFVRHPFSRVLSQYYNWIDRDRVRKELALVADCSRSSPHFEQLREKFETKIFDMSLLEFLASDDSDISQVVNNIQCQYMTDFEMPEYVRFNKAFGNAMTRYDFVGLKELYEPCLRIVETRCCLPKGMLGGGGRMNASGLAKIDGKYPITEPELTVLERRSVYDLALFHVCHAMLLMEHEHDLPETARDFDFVADLPVLVG